MTDTKQCPVCAGRGHIFYGMFDAVCNLCHGRGSIRPTQDPRFLFWNVILLASMEIDDGIIHAIEEWDFARGYAMKKCASILAKQPRRTTATWRKPR